MPDRPEAASPEQVSELSRRFGFHLEQWTRGRTPHWARPLVDPGAVVMDTLREVAREHDVELLQEEALLVRLRRTLYDNVRTRVSLARPGRQAADSNGALNLEPPLRDPALAPDLFQRYEAALTRLAPADRAAVIARAELRLPWSDVADLLAKSTVSAARMTVGRALIRLAREMSNERRG